LRPVSNRPACQPPDDEDGAGAGGVVPAWEGWVDGPSVFAGAAGPGTVGACAAEAAAEAGAGTLGAGWVGAVAATPLG
jgi:hypothetical protein